MSSETIILEQIAPARIQPPALFDPELRHFYSPSQAKGSGSRVGLSIVSLAKAALANHDAVRRLTMAVEYRRANPRRAALWEFGGGPAAPTGRTSFNCCAIVASAKGLPVPGRDIVSTLYSNNPRQLNGRQAQVVVEERSLVGFGYRQGDTRCYLVYRVESVGALPKRPDLPDDPKRYGAINLQLMALRVDRDREGVQGWTHPVMVEQGVAIDQMMGAMEAKLSAPQTTASYIRKLVHHRPGPIQSMVPVVASGEAAEQNREIVAPEAFASRLEQLLLVRRADLLSRGGEVATAPVPVTVIVTNPAEDGSLRLVATHYEPGVPATTGEGLVFQVVGSLACDVTAETYTTVTSALPALLPALESFEQLTSLVGAMVRHLRSYH